ncbi:MAG: DNA polymerase III subunit gamma/tau [Tyzzerella sp.]|nr:DNA polymerase III subunit gamma/tau [Tyzzerella sp.]
MSYTALYRKFRPGEFEDVKGQDHISKTLQNQIKAGRIGHAYLFCGTRGTGKTSVAKIFAKAVNCLSPVNGSPCGECEMCKAISNGTSMNVIEIDAASNNGVDNIREIREEVAYRPTEGKYKVYIIDEVHMLSIGAFNALLKTLEEPPEYVIFILATTEAHKIPITILSRCQRYDFKRITIDTIAARLTDLMQQEGIEVEERAIRYISKVADGSMRDALSLLDQCIAFYLGQKLTYENVLEVLGAVDTEVFSRLLREILEKNVSKVLRSLEELIMQGRELGQLATDFTWYLRNLLLAKSSDNMEDVLDVSSENLAQLKEEAQMIEYDTLIRYIRIFSELSNQLKYATQKRVLLEVALIKLCKPEMEVNQDSVLARIRAVEEKLEAGIPAARQEVVYVNRAEEPQEELPKVELSKALHEDVKAVVKDFRMIANQAAGMTKVYLKQAHLSVGNQDQLLLVFDDEVAAGFIGSDSHKEEIKRLIEERIGKTVDIEVRHVEEGRRFEDSFVDIEKLVHMDITIEE